MFHSREEADTEDQARLTEDTSINTFPVTIGRYINLQTEEDFEREGDVAVLSSRDLILVLRTIQSSFVASGVERGANLIAVEPARLLAFTVRWKVLMMLLLWRVLVDIVVESSTCRTRSAVRSVRS